MNDYRLTISALAILLLVAASNAWSQAIVTSDSFVDDFNDGNIDEWVVGDIIGALIGSPFAQISFPEGGVRIAAPATPNPAFVVSRVAIEQQHLEIADFEMSVDIVDRAELAHNNFGLLARTQNLGPGTTDGYLLFGLLLDNGLTAFGIDRLDDEFITFLSGNTQGTAADIPLDSAKDYRVVFKGEGSMFTGEIFDLDDLSTPLATVTATDDTYSSGFSGLLSSGGGVPPNFDSLSHGDITFDNYTLVTAPVIPRLQAGDANQDLNFDQLDLVQVQVAGKYLTGQNATWGEGDWNGAPGGAAGSPPAGDGLFNQLDIIAAQQGAAYLTGPYAAVQPNGQSGDGQTSVVYNPANGELAVDSPTGMELTSINIASAAGIFTSEAAASLGGSFDNDADNNIFKATFGGSFGSLSFGKVAQAGLSEEFVLGDLSVVGSLAGGGGLANVDLVYVPEPTSSLLLATGLVVIGLLYIRRTRGFAHPFARSATRWCGHFHAPIACSAPSRRVIIA